MPGMYELISGDVSVDRLREVRVEDLLRRAPVQLDLASIRTYVEGRVVLVTGAGGSIGGELARQLARFRTGSPAAARSGREQHGRGRANARPGASRRGLATR